MHFAAAWPMRSYRVLLYNGHSFLPCRICMAGKLCYTKVYLKTKAIQHNSKCRYGERGAADAKPKAQIILDAAKVSAASGGNSEPKQGQRSQSARGFCPRSTMRVPQPDIIEHFGNADAVPQLPERCLSRKAGIVRCCPKNKQAPGKFTAYEQCSAACRGLASFYIPVKMSAASGSTPHCRGWIGKHPR